MPVTARGELRAYQGNGVCMSSSGRPDLSANGATLPNQAGTQIRYFIAGLVFLAASAIVWPVLGRGVERFQFMPHVFCYLGNPTLIRVNLISDLLIGISYVVISLTLVYLVRASKGAIPFHWMFLAFGTFIIACGGTHFMEAITLWHPVYWASAYVKVITAVASVATAIALPLAMRKILGSIESMRLSETRAIELAHANRDLNAANEKLQELDRLRRRFVAQAAANIGDWQWDIPAGKVQWSPEVEDMHGLARGSFSGTFEEWLTTVHPDDRERAIASVKEAIQNRCDYDVEYRTMRPDGVFYWTAARGAVEYDAAGQPVRMVGMCMDISARKRTEEALRKSEKLAAAGRLAATIAHEINNPLEAVTNLLFLARAEQIPENSKRLLDAADHELQRVGHITRQTLGFYRETATPSEIDLGAILKGVVDVFGSKLESKGVTVNLQLKDPVLLHGVPGELRQVFSNILSNAIDAAPAGSQVNIRIKSAGENIQIAIADRGSGIPQAARAQIFEPFFTTKKDVGTGLGLWISREIIHNHGGTIRFRSRVETMRSGTVFVVTLSKKQASRCTAA
jgi:PAS domain S-box-containing protein